MFRCRLPSWLSLVDNELLLERKQRRCLWRRRNLTAVIKRPRDLEHFCICKQVEAFEDFLREEKKRDLKVLNYLITIIISPP